MYKDVENKKCHFCEATISGNQQFMLGGKQLPSKMGRITKELKAKQEHKWIWNGLHEYIGDIKVTFDFYLCPNHQKQGDYNTAFEWAEMEIDKVKDKYNATPKDD